MNQLIDSDDNSKIDINVMNPIDVVPQRYPLLLIDKISKYEPNKWIHGVKNISKWEPMLVQAGSSRYPYGLIVESIGQLAIALLNINNPAKSRDSILLGSIGDIEFLGEVQLGCQLELQAEIERSFDDTFIFNGQASVLDQVVLSVGSLIVKINN